jgi:hypothetical protein
MNLAESIAHYLPQPAAEEATAGGVIGGIVGNILRGQQ